ncbi:anti-sigma factor family protein [Pseudomonas sp. P3C3]
MNTELDDRALLELLPWYLNGTLEGAELAAVEALLLRSAEAREELEVLRRLAAAVREQEQAHEAPPFELGWARLQRSLQQEARPAPRRDWWKPGLAAAAALVIALQLGILMRPAQVDSDWQLQSGGSEQVLSGGYRVQLRFVEHAQWQQIRALLLELDAVLVDGPSALGVVQVHVPADKRFRDGQALLQWLQQQAVVQHAALLAREQP